MLIRKRPTWIFPKVSGVNFKFTFIINDWFFLYVLTI
jgi:hypothetical protein